MAVRFEILFENSLFHWRLVDDDQVVFRAADNSSKSAVQADAIAKRALLIAAVAAPTPGDVVSAVELGAVAEAAAAQILDLTAGISDDKGGSG